MEFFLSRSASSETQDIADARCAEYSGNSTCGACLVGPEASYIGYDIGLWNITRMNDSMVRFDVSSLPGESGLANACSIGSGVCGIREVEYLLDQPEVMDAASDALGSAMFIQSKRRVTEENLDKPSTLGTIGIEYDVPASEYDYSSGYNEGSQCGICYSTGSVVWVSGDGAEDFVDRLNQSSEIFGVAVEEDVEVMVQRNRREIENEAVPFTGSSSFDFSSCGMISKHGYYDYRWDDDDDVDQYERDGLIWNSENPTVYDAMFSDEDLTEVVCRDPEGPVSAYHERFPDAGVLLSRKVDSGFTTIGVTWLFNEASDVVASYDLERQAVYSVYCQSDQANTAGECIPDAELICARTVPAENCGYSSSWKDYNDFAEKTYSYLSSVIGDMPVFRSSYEVFEVEFHAALSLQDIGLLAFIYCVCFLPIIPNLTSSLVSEKHQRHVYSLILNGMNLGSYWVSQYLYHAAQTSILEIIVVVSTRIFNLRVYDKGDIRAGLLLVLFLSYTHAQFGFVVLVSNLFKRERFAAVAVGTLAIAMAGTGILMHLATDGTSGMSEWSWYWALFPTIGLFRGLVLIFWGRHSSEIWRIVTNMLVSSSLYLAVGIYWHGATGVGALFKVGCATPTKIKEDDQDFNNTADGLEADIAQEEAKALKVSHDETAVKMAHLGKTFPTRPEPKHAVVDLSLAIDYGEIFGLLGPNGCGKVRLRWSNVDTCTRTQYSLSSFYFGA